MLYGRLFELSEDTKLTITNACTCYIDDDTPSDYCFGDCFENDAMYLDDLIDCTGTWHVDAEDIGWRNMSGEKDFDCSDPESWLQAVAGFDCVWTMQIMIQDKDNIDAYVYHHDSPTGERRVIRRIQ